MFHRPVNQGCSGPDLRRRSCQVIVALGGPSRLDKALEGSLKKSLLISICAFLTTGLLVSKSFAETLVASWQGYYVGKIDRPEGGSELVEVDVFPAYEGQAMFIDLMVTRNPPGRVLGAVSAATNVNQKQFAFSFTDGWGNRGRGTFSRDREKFVLHLELVKKSSSGATVANLYGDYELLKKETKGKSDRHPWSLGRRRSNKSAKPINPAPREPGNSK